MYWCDYCRFQDPEEFNSLNDKNEYEDMEGSFNCPYCQFFSPPSDMSRQPHPGGGVPSGPPPAVTPSKEKAQVKSISETKAVDPGSIRPCLFRYVYIWPRRGKPFWAWLTYVGRRSASGYRWQGRRWVYFGMDLRQIESFTCY